MPNLQLREFFLQFAAYVLDDNNNSPTGFPAYDSFYRYFDQLIQKLRIPQPAYVSWLTPEEREIAIQELVYNPVLDISRMNEPVPIDENNYPKVNFNHFREQYYGASNFGALFDKTKSFDRTNSFAKRT